MRKLFRKALLLMLISSHSYAWNAMGHLVVAQIAYDHLTPQVKRAVNQYNQSLNTGGSKLSFIMAGPWLDTLRVNGIPWFNNLHYIALPFSVDKTPLTPVQNINVIRGVKQAVTVLASKYTTDADKGLALRILLHIVGDLHQPLHTATRVSRGFPRGD